MAVAARVPYPSETIKGEESVSSQAAGIPVFGNSSVAYVFSKESDVYYTGIE